nr:CCA tRNA nucleotidyltransferase [Synechococcus sp. RSCCF101]
MALPGVPDSLLDRLRRAAAPARVALVGGAVRDLLLHRVHRDPWRGLLDLDLVVEGSPGAGSCGEPAAHALAHRLIREHPEAVGSHCFHAAYGTVELELDGVWLDLATARREVYSAPGLNPEVAFADLEADLARRDFSLNAMALVLGEEGSGRWQLLDPHAGQSALEQRQLAFLHDGSVRDDPSRVLRAARYAARLGFEPGAEALGQIRRTLADWPWAWRPGDPAEAAPPALAVRLRMELDLLLQREPWPQALRHLEAWGALALIDPSLSGDRGWRRRLHWARRLELPLLPALLAGAADPAAAGRRLQIPARQLAWLEALPAVRAVAARGPVSPSAWCAALEGQGWGEEAVRLALACGLTPRRPLLRWCGRWRHATPPVSARELIAAGLPPGPALGARLRQLRAEHLDAHDHV